MNTKKRLVDQKTIKIQAKPLAEEQVQLFISFYNKNGSFPGSKIPCNVTGKLTTCVGPWLKKKVKEFGSAENLIRNYKCRGALKTERDIIKPVSNKQKIKIKKKDLIAEKIIYDIPKINFNPPRPMTEAELTEASKTECFRPDIFLTNGRHCDGCHYYKLCINKLKTLPKYIKQNKQ